MDIKRCTQSFRSGGAGFAVGDLVPAAHPLTGTFAQFFEPVADYVTRLYPQYAPEADAPEAQDAPKEPAKKTAAPRTPRKPKA